MLTASLYNCEGFDWDEGNSDKNWHLHQVTDAECEEIFFNLPLVVASDTKHSSAKRGLFVAFTIRNNRLRVISARDMNQKEVKRYAERRANEF